MQSRRGPIRPTLTLPSLIGRESVRNVCQRNELDSRLSRRFVRFTDYGREIAASLHAAGMKPCGSVARAAVSRQPVRGVRGALAVIRDRERR